MESNSGQEETGGTLAVDDDVIALTLDNVPTQVSAPIENEDASIDITPGYI
jgi:hypothetical protein